MSGEDLLASGASHGGEWRRGVNAEERREMVARKTKVAATKSTRRKATSRKSPGDRARAAFDDSLRQLEKRLPKNLASMARELRRNLKEIERQIDKARKEREDRWNRLEAQIRGDAARLLRRLEKAVEPRPGGGVRKKATRKKPTRSKAAPQKAADR
jgi:TolA-binding protein